MAEYEDQEQSKSVIPLGEELYKRIMSGDLDAPNIFNNQESFPRESFPRKSYEGIDPGNAGKRLMRDLMPTPQPTRPRLMQRINAARMKGIERRPVGTGSGKMRPQEAPRVFQTLQNMINPQMQAPPQQMQAPPQLYTPLNNQGFAGGPPRPYTVAPMFNMNQPY